MITEIHAVKAVYDSTTFNPNVAIQTSQPLYYDCYVCPFQGTLEQSVEHIVKNQFKVEPPVQKPVTIAPNRTKPRRFNRTGR